MRKILLMLAAITLLGFSAALAHDADPIFVDLGLGESYDFGHEEEAPWKGTATITVTNTGTESWGNFHFQIFDPMFEGNYMDVIFTTGDGVYPMMNGVTMDPANFEIVTAPNGYSQINLYFHEMPVNPTESVEFIVYTDNTASEHSFFGMMMWPSGVVASNDQSLSAVKALFQ
jgi:hypothetical protein